MMNIKYRCPCCGYYTFDEPTGKTYDICPICFWEDGGDIDSNGVSLSEARVNFKMYAACTPKMLKFVRYATPKDRISGDINDITAVTNPVDTNIFSQYFNTSSISVRFSYLYDNINGDLAGILDCISGFVYGLDSYSHIFKTFAGKAGIGYLILGDFSEKNLICSDISQLPRDIYDMHDEEFFKACFSIKELTDYSRKR